MSFEDDEYWEEQYSDHSRGGAALARDRYSDSYSAPVPDPAPRPRAPRGQVIRTSTWDGEIEPAIDLDAPPADELAARRRRRSGKSPVRSGTEAPQGDGFDSARPGWLDDPEFVPTDVSGPDLAGPDSEVLDFNRPELGANFDNPEYQSPAGAVASRRPPARRTPPPREHRPDRRFDGPDLSDPDFVHGFGDGYDDAQYAADLAREAARHTGERPPEPRRPDPRSANPRSSDPRSPDLRSADPRRPDLRSADPRRTDPRNLDPRRLDPRDRPEPHDQPEPDSRPGPQAQGRLAGHPGRARPPRPSDRVRFEEAFESADDQVAYLDDRHGRPTDEAWDNDDRRGRRPARPPRSRISTDALDDGPISGETPWNDPSRANATWNDPAQADSAWNDPAPANATWNDPARDDAAWNDPAQGDAGWNDPAQGGAAWVDPARGDVGRAPTGRAEVEWADEDVHEGPIRPVGGRRALRGQPSPPAPQSSAPPAATGRARVPISPAGGPAEDELEIYRPPRENPSTSAEPERPAARRRPSPGRTGAARADEAAPAAGRATPGSVSPAAGRAVAGSPHPTPGRAIPDGPHPAAGRAVPDGPHPASGHAVPGTTYPTPGRAAAPGGHPAPSETPAATYGTPAPASPDRVAPPPTSPQDGYVRPVSGAGHGRPAVDGDPSAGAGPENDGPRVVSKAAPPTAPRVISKAEPPAVPKVIRKADPPAVPRVIKVEPPVAPARVIPATPPPIAPARPAAHSAEAGPAARPDATPPAHHDPATRPEPPRPTPPPAAGQVATPYADQPAQLAAGQDAMPYGDQPGHRAAGQSAVPYADQPVHPAARQPATPNTGQPAHPAAGQSTVPQADQPSARPTAGARDDGSGRADQSPAKVEAPQAAHHGRVSLPLDRRQPTEGPAGKQPRIVAPDPSAGWAAPGVVPAAPGQDGFAQLPVSPAPTNRPLPTGEDQRGRPVPGYSAMHGDSGRGVPDQALHSVAPGEDRPDFGAGPAVSGDRGDSGSQVRPVSPAARAFPQVLADPADLRPAPLPTIPAGPRHGERTADTMQPGHERTTDSLQPDRGQAAAKTRPHGEGYDRAAATPPAGMAPVRENAVPAMPSDPEQTAAPTQPHGAGHDWAAATPPPVRETAVQAMLADHGQAAASMQPHGVGYDWAAATPPGGMPPVREGAVADLGVGAAAPVPAQTRSRREPTAINGGEPRPVEDRTAGDGGHRGQHRGGAATGFLTPAGENGVAAAGLAGTSATATPVVPAPRTGGTMPSPATTGSFPVLDNVAPIARLATSGPDQAKPKYADADLGPTWFTAKSPGAETQAESANAETRTQNAAAEALAQKEPAEALAQSATAENPAASATAEASAGGAATTLVEPAEAEQTNTATAPARESTRPDNGPVPAQNSEPADAQPPGPAAPTVPIPRQAGPADTAPQAGADGHDGVVLDFDLTGLFDGTGVTSEHAVVVPRTAPERETETAEAAPPVRPLKPLSAEDLEAIRWRLDGGTLREVVDDQQALRELGDRLDGPLADEQDNITRSGLLSVRAEVYRLLGELGMAAAASRLALAHAESAGDVQSMVIAQAELAHVLRLRGDFPEADRLFEVAASSESAEVLRSVVHENAGRSCFDQGRHMEALDHFARAVRLGDPEDTDLVDRIGVCLEAVYIHVLRDGWGPYPRLRREILGPVRAPDRPRPLETP